MNDNLKCTDNNLIEIEYSVNYQSYDVISNTELSGIRLLNSINDTQLTLLKKTKLSLNAVKSKIDECQSNISKTELIKKYGTDNLFELLRMNTIDDNLKKQFKKCIFYDKLTNKIYMMNFKYQIKTNFNIENVSNAGLKLTEILNHEKIINKENITNNYYKHFANAEMPGNFIVAVNFFIKTNLPNVHYDWYGNSLLPGVMGPKSEGLPDYYGYYKNHRDKWIMDEKKMNGDITDIKNIEYIKKYFEKEGKCDLYTSDAGVSLDIDDFNEQELVVMKLKLAEILCALISLKETGNMVVKIYTFFEKATIDVLIILSKLFKTFKIVKPMSSKPTNSENYIIGIGYIGYDKSLIYIDLFTQKINDFNNYGYIQNINNDDILLLSNISDIIYNKQIIFINRNIYYFNKYYNESSSTIINDIYTMYIKKLINYYYEKFINDNNLKPLPFSDNL
jgi:hypothetical protein